MGARSIQPTFRPVRPGKEDHLKRWTCFFETFPVGPNRSIEFWTEISGNFGWMDRALGHDWKKLCQFFPFCCDVSSTTCSLQKYHSIEFLNVYIIPDFFFLSKKSLPWVPETSSAVSGFCQVFIYSDPRFAARPKMSAFGQHWKFPLHARKTSGTKGKKSLLLSNYLAATKTP